MKSMKDFYKAKYRGSFFVVKAGGRIIADEQARLSLLEDIKELVGAGIKVLLIYGGGKLIDQALEAQNIVPFKIEGRRITTEDQIDVVKKVLSGDLSYRIGATMAKINLHGLCLSTIPAGWVKITMRPNYLEKERYDGTIQSVYADQINNIFDAIPFVVCPCIGISDKNGVNINADDVAVAIASGCQSRKLIFLSDVDGVIVNGETATLITDEEIPKLIQEGIATDGMQVKLENCVHALQNGVRRIHLLNGFTPHILSREIFETVSPTTMIIREQDRQSYLNEIKVEKAIGEEA